MCTATETLDCALDYPLVRDRAALAHWVSKPYLKSLTYVVLVLLYVCKHLKSHLPVLDSPVRAKSIKRISQYPTFTRNIPVTTRYVSGSV